MQKTTAKTPNRNMDILLKGGFVMDPANHKWGYFDIGIQNGTILRIEPSIDKNEATKTINAQGLLVTPGLIDIHVHAYSNRRYQPDLFFASIDADANLPSSGVTTCVDTGTAGSEEFDHFRETIIDKSHTRILAFLNIATFGMGLPEQNPSNFTVENAIKTARQNPQTIVGIKSAHYWTKQPFDKNHTPWKSVERAIQAGESCGLPVMVDFWPRPPERTYQDLILKKLRRGDIHTHMFAKQFPIIDEQGSIEDHMFEARDRGILFDMGHGAASFWFKNALPAFKQNFPPDTISTDLHMENINGPVFNMLETMSKCLAMGMPLKEVISRSTVEPARVINRTDLGTLSLGAKADIAVIEQQTGTFSYRDCASCKINGKNRLKCKLTLREGKIIFEEK